MNTVNADEMELNCFVYTAYSNSRGLKIYSKQIGIFIELETKW